MGNQKGFTLIELVVVIVILGILAAVAIPKFVDMQVDAREAAVEGLYGAVISAAALAHAQALVKGASTTGIDTIDMEGTTVTINNGYPDAAANGIEAAINMEGFSFDATTTPPVFTLDSAPGSSTACQVEYTAALAGNQPTINLDITDCD